MAQKNGRSYINRFFLTLGLRFVVRRCYVLSFQNLAMFPTLKSFLLKSRIFGRHAFIVVGIKDKIKGGCLH